MRRWVAGLAMVAALGCGRGDAQLLPSGGIWEVTVQSPPTEAVVTILAIDPAPTPDGEAMRAAIVSALAPSLERLRPGHEAGQWQPVDWSVVLVLPSGRIVGPPDVPGLALRTQSVDTPAIDALVATIADVVAEPDVDPAAPFPVLEAAHATAQLVVGERHPANAAEEALHEAVRLRDVPGGHARGLIFVVVGATRDDESPASVESLALPAEANGWLVSPTAVLPSEDCATFATTPRIEAWLRTQSSEPQGFPCAADDLASRGVLPLGSWTTNGSSWACASRPIAARADGGAECSVQVQWYAPDLDCADAGRGWLDLADPNGVRRPRLAEDAGGTFRVCEVPQLVGGGCPSDPQCSGCGDGWCRTDLDLGRQCAPGEVAVPIRFTGGAIAGSPARARIRCVLE